MGQVSHRPGAGLMLQRAGVVAIGGALGTTARAALEAAAPAAAGAVPWTTFAINVAGSFALGVLLDVLARGGPDEGRRRIIRLLCGTGLLGGFTTYSTFIGETERLLSGGATLLALGYAVASVLIGVGAAVVGILMTRRLSRQRSR